MKKLSVVVLCVLCSLMGASAFSKEFFKNLETEASGLYGWSGDFNGYGVALKAGCPILENKRHFIELEADFLNLKDSFSCSKSIVLMGIPSITIASTSSQIDEYFLFVNYKYEKQIVYIDFAKFDYYLGVGLGLYYADVSSQITYIDYLGGTTPAGQETLDTSGNHFSPAAQAFGGIKYHLTDAVAFKLGAKAVLADKVDALSPSNKVLSSTDYLQFVLEAGISISW